MKTFTKSLLSALAILGCSAQTNVESSLKAAAPQAMQANGAQANVESSLKAAAPQVKENGELEAAPVAAAMRTGKHHYPDDRPTYFEHKCRKYFCPKTCPRRSRHGFRQNRHRSCESVSIFAPGFHAEACFSSCKKPSWRHAQWHCAKLCWTSFGSPFSVTIKERDYGYGVTGCGCLDGRQSGPGYYDASRWRSQLGRKGSVSKASRPYSGRNLAEENDDQEKVFELEDTNVPADF